MTGYWPWGLMITVSVTVTIWANGNGYRWGWLLGVAAQLFQVGFGVATGIWTFYFALVPGVMFGWNWWQHPLRVRLAEMAARQRNAPPSMVLFAPNAVSEDEMREFIAKWDRAREEKS